MGVGVAGVKANVVGKYVPAEPHQLPLLPAEQDPGGMSLHQFIESKTRLFLVLEIPRIAESQNDQGLEGTLEQRRKTPKLQS